MDRIPALAILVIYSILMSPLAMAQSSVGLATVVRLGEVDLGLEGASISPDGGVVIAHGADSTVFLIDPESPENHSKLDHPGNLTMHDSSFHPGSNTALVVGDGGGVLRFVRSNNSLEDVGGGLLFGSTDLMAVSWNSDGSWAYIGGELGWLWRARSMENGGLEAFALEGRGDSDVSGISCVPGSNVCVVSSSVDGIGVIDGDHGLHWIGGFGLPWVGVVCPSGSEMRCVAVSTDLTIAIVSINPGDPSKSMIFDNDVFTLQDAEGQINGIEVQSDGISLISTAPFGIIEHDLQARASFKWLENSDAVNFSAHVSDERIVATWSTGSFEGWLITSEGTIVSFSPIEGSSNGGLLEIWIGIVILGGATLLVFSLMASSSPRLSRWVAMRIGSEEERKRAIREERLLSKKK